MNSGYENDIHVVSIADNKYAQHLAVTFASLLLNASSEASFHLYVITTGLSEENKDKLSRTVEKLGARLQFLTVDASPYERFNPMDNNSRETYIRLSIVDVVPQHVNKIICIDSDVVVTGDIVDLWDTDLEGRAVAAVIDEWASTQCEVLKIPKGLYFNAGIMIMDLEKWRRDSIVPKTMEYLTRNMHLLKYHEQDALNALLFNDWIPLPATWNAHSTIIKEWKSAVPPAAIHFTGLSKPWQFDNIHPFKQEYYKYLRMTEWKSYKPEVNVRRIVKRLTRPLVPVLEKTLPRPAVSFILKFKAILN